MNNKADAKERERFLTVGAWHEFCLKTSKIPEEERPNLLEMRRVVYREIEKLRGHPLLVYASSFIELKFRGLPVSIDLADIEGFSDLVNSVPSNIEEVDFLIHSPGGSPEATERIVQIIRSRFSKVNFLVPHSAYSAATMLALSGNQVLLHPIATLGPIDPQINGIPARSIRRGFENVRDVLREEGPEALPAYMPLIEKCSLQELEICDDYLKLSQELVADWLFNYMFNGDEAHKNIAEEAAMFFSNYDIHKTHSRPLNFDKIKHLNLKIEIMEDGLHQLATEAYILMSGFFSVTSFFKLFENSADVSWGRQGRIVNQTEN